MKRDDPKWIIPWSNTFFLFPEIPLEQSGESLSMAGFVAGHFMHGVIEGLTPLGEGD